METNMDVQTINVPNLIRMEKCYQLTSTIKNYEEGRTNILFISNIDLIRGLSLESTSHLIFFHDLPVFELKQVLIHSAQRIGRKDPLMMVHLNSEIQV